MAIRNITLPASFVISSSTLPTGAATEATLGTRATEATLSTRASEATLSALSAKVTKDGTTNSLNIIDYPHHEIHDGSAFLVARSVTINNTISSEVRFATPDTTKWAPMVLSLDASAKTDFYLFEATTKTHNAGNALTAINRNRNSATTSGLTICHTPDGAGDGTQLLFVQFGLDTGVGVNRVVSGGNSAGRNEIILKQNTAYLIRVTSGTDGNRVTINLDWYEHTNV